MTSQKSFKPCPGQSPTPALAFNPRKPNFGHRKVIRSPRIPTSNSRQAQMKDPRGLIVLGEVLGEDPTDPYPMGNEAFIQDRLRDVTKALANDLRKIAILPDKLEGDAAGLQVAWALVSKPLPPQVVRLLRTHPVEQTQETCDTLARRLA